MPLDDGSTPGSALSPTTPGSGLTARDTEKLDKDPNARVKALGEAQARSAADSERVAADTKSQLGAIDQQADRLKPPEFQSLPYAPPKPTSPVEQWGSVAMMAAMLGSLFVRGHATAALDAASAVMTGFKSADKQATDQAFQQWKVANENMLKASEFQRKAYDDAMKGFDRKERSVISASATEQRAIKARIDAQAAAFKDETMLELGRTKGVAAQEKEMNRREKQDAEIEALRAKTEKQYQDIQEKQQLQERYQALTQDPEYQQALQTGNVRRQAEMRAAIGDPQAVKMLAATKADELNKQKATDAAAKADKIKKVEDSPEYQDAIRNGDQQGAARLKAFAGDPDATKFLSATKPRAGAGANQPLDSADEAAAQAIAHYSAGLQNLPRAKQVGMLARVKEINPEFNAGTFGNQQKALSHWTDPNASGAKQIQSYDRVAQHLGVVRDLAKALDNGGVPAFNKVANAFGIATGDEAASNFDAAKAIIATEVVKATSGVPGTGGDREEAREGFNRNATQGQMTGAFDTIEKFIAGGLNASMSQYAAGTGHSKDDFVKMLSSETQERFLPLLKGAAPKSGESVSTPAAVPPAAIDELKQHAGDPVWVKSFDKHFGEGAAARALGQ